MSATLPGVNMFDSGRAKLKDIDHTISWLLPRCISAWLLYAMLSRACPPASSPRQRFVPVMIMTAQFAIRIPLCICITLLFTSVLLAQEKLQQKTTEKTADPREKIETAVPHAIKLLEEKRHDELLKKYMPPKTLEQAIDDLGSMQELIKAFEGDNADELLQTLRLIKDKKPKLNADGKTAIFELDTRVSAHESLTFEKIDNYWRIKN